MWGRGSSSFWLLLLLQPLPPPGSFLPGAAEARGTWDVFMEAASSEGPPLSHRTGSLRPLPPFTGTSSLTDQSGFTLPSSPAACTAGLWPKGTRAHLISARVSPLEASGECCLMGGGKNDFCSSRAPFLLSFRLPCRETNPGPPIRDKASPSDASGPSHSHLTQLVIWPLQTEPLARVDPLGGGSLKKTPLWAEQPHGLTTR